MADHTQYYSATPKRRMGRSFTLYRKLAGKEPTPKGIEDAKRTLEQGRQD
jgi:hypothetical protein